jgi:RNA polymerase sigma-70 factor, ECF subfamily
VSDFAQELALQIPRLRRYARALSGNVAWADDLVQDTLERALRRRWLFRFSGNLSGWLYKILFRLYLNQAAQRRLLPLVSPEEAPEPSAAEDIGLKLDMQRALARLSPEQRAVVLLVGLEQLSYQEAAEALQIPLGTVMSRLARGREQLRIQLDREPAAPGNTPKPRPPSLVRIK